MLDDIFKSRVDLKKGKEQSYYDSIIEKAKSIDVSKINFDKIEDRDFIVEKQKTYLWVRLMLYNEYEIVPNTLVKILYKPSGEEIDATFICYNKETEINSDGDLDEISKYSDKEDPKVLCLMVDEDSLSYDKPVISGLFPNTRYYMQNVFRKDELVFIDLSNNTTLDYYTFIL